MKRVFTWQVLLLAAVFSQGAKDENASKIQEPAKSIGSIVSSKATVDDLKKVQKEAEPIIENILAAMNAKNHERYIRDFNASMKAAYPQDVFKKNTRLLGAAIGKYVSRTPWKGEIANQYFTIYYQAKFTKAKGPVVVRLVLERNDNKLQVVFLSFDAPELKDLKEKQSK